MYMYMCNLNVNCLVSGNNTSGGVHKPVPGKALLPVLDVFTSGPSPTPPPGAAPEIQRPLSETYLITTRSSSHLLFL